jgi:hypothetical protein
MDTYKKNIDYNITIIKSNNKGRPKEQIMITFICFKKLCLFSKTNNANYIRKLLI